MNFKGITLAVLSFLLVAVSCSVEDDAFMNNNNMNNVESSTVISDQEAYLSFNVNTNVATKAAGSFELDTLNSVSTCSVVLFDNNNNILAVKDGVKVENGALQNCSFLTKVRNDLKVAVIANTTKSFENCPTMKEVRETVQDQKDLETLVKYGEAAVSFDGVKGSASTKENVPTVTVNVKLSQLAAIVELASFNVTFAEGAKEAAVEVTRVVLVNANTEAYTAAEGRSSIATLTETANLSTANFRTYPSQKVTMQIFYTVGEKEYSTKAFKINGGSVENGYIYRLNVKMTQNAHDVDMNVELSVKDWTNNTISMDMTEE